MTGMTGRALLRVDRDDAQPVLSWSADSRNLAKPPAAARERGAAQVSWLRHGYDLDAEQL